VEAEVSLPCSKDPQTVLDVESLCYSSSHSRLGGVVVNVLATGPKGRGFKTGRGDGFLRTIKICSTSSFGWEVKPEVPCSKILRHIKDPLRYLRY
jgi:hypothetical protein